MLTLILFTAVVIVIAMASLGEESQGWRVAAYVAMVGLGVAPLMLGLIFLLGAALRVSLPVDLDPLRLGLGLMAGGAACWLALLPPVRHILARIIPLRPESPVNAVALSLLALLWAQSIGLSGLGPEGFLALAGPVSLGQVLLSEVPLAVIALLGAGFLIRRSRAETWARLGLARLTWRQGLLCLGGVAALISFEVATSAVASRVAPQAYDELSRAALQLYSGIDTPLAALVVALASGTAEELLFRGALQPRFGLLVTALTFGVIHLQYGVSWSLLSVGAIGLVLGLYRQRVNTTACILVHALYNLAVFLLP